MLFQQRLSAASLASLCALVLLPSCNRERMEIEETRVLSKSAMPAMPNATSEQRFGPALREMGMEAPAAPPDMSMFRDLLAWEAPDGWKETEARDPTGMRLVDFRFGPNDEGECYITLMGGNAGGLEANINRWRTQMGQPPYTAEEIAKLPKKPFFNREGVFVSFDGDFKKFGAESAAKHHRLLGLVHTSQEATIFVKLTGPKALVAQNEAAFDQFCQSIQARSPNE